ncbi:hypothetical protein SG34_007645 [Thalassomonas viridans]|uniref:Outer membrane protein beta-barrel domain-containing protein n=1 Tax=Thalassomonas viridans TaxID=137584 RepID=A0AAF0CAP9_9GAMM|nr:hypothetical protein [Thalassomonas viridans]WDE06766.1 hypothetical protein SG34_007645 [Thalassomonas viridans]
MFIRAAKIYFVLVLAWLSLMANSQDLPPEAAIAVGIEKQVALEQETTFNGVFISARKSLLTSLVLFGQWRFLEDSIAGNDFELQQQELQLGYRLSGYGDIIWLFSAGGQREQVKHSAAGFDSKTTETGLLAAIEANYQINFEQGVLLALEYREKQAHERYNFRAGYHYRPLPNWQFGFNLTLGYNDKFNHDLNEYRLIARYLF